MKKLSLINIDFERKIKSPGFGWSVLAIASAGLAVVFALAHRAEAGDPATGLIKVPIRWCAVEGSPAVTSPAIDTDHELLNRHWRAGHRVWVPGANITFNSAIPAVGVLTDELHSFPVIPDPGGPGLLGDILDPDSFDRTEYDAAVRSCEMAWAERGAQLGKTLVGPIALNIRRFVAPDGSPTNLEGFSWHRRPNCTLPHLTGNRKRDSLAVIDRAFGADPDEKVLAHELGHILLLGHGNGLDDDPDQNDDDFFDSICSPNEPEDALPLSLMSPDGATMTTVITARQKAWARSVAKKTAGAGIDPPGVVLQGDVVGAYHPDPAHDVAAPDVDIVSASIAIDSAEQTTTMSHLLLGDIPLLVDNEYAFYLDADNDSGTGGEPSTLGLPTSFEGAEVVTIVLVTSNAGVRLIDTEVYKFDGSDFVEVIDASIKANVSTSISEDGQEFDDGVWLEMSNAVRGPMADEVRFQASSLQFGGPADQLPDGTPDLGAPLLLTPTEYPICQALPDLVTPGAVTNVLAAGLFPDEVVEVFLGDDKIGDAMTDALGDLDTEISIPGNASAGPGLLAVRVAGTAVTADCPLTVSDTPASLTVPLDIKPGACPNSLSNKGKGKGKDKAKGKLPVAFVGSAEFDVNFVDSAQVLLEGVSPLSSSLEDVSAPFFPPDDPQATDCSKAGPDGFADLVLLFDEKSVITALGPISNGELRVLHMTGNLLPEHGSTPIAGEDVVIIKN